MRFTTWSTVTNVLIVSTVALFSLIPAANAFDLIIASPAGGGTHQPGERARVSWYTEGIDFADIDSELSGQICDIVMMGSDNGYSYLLLEAVPILNLQAYVTYPAVTDYSTSYYISVQTENGTFSSDSFMMGDD